MEKRKKFNIYLNRPLGVALSSLCFVYRNRATSRRSRLVAAPLGFQAKMHFLCVFYVVIWTSK